MIRYNEETGEPMYIPDEEINTAEEEVTAEERLMDRNPMKKNKHIKKGSSTLMKGVKLAAGGAIFGLVSGVTMAGVNTVVDAVKPSVADQIETTHSSEMITDEKGETENTGVNTLASMNNGNTSIITSDISGVVDQVMPSVVSITCTMNQTNYFGQMSQGTAAGSGFIIAKNKDKLMLATNNHVVDGATELTVGFVDGETAPAVIVGRDPSSDLAVISVELKDVKADTAKAIKVAVLGDSSKLKVGETVIAIGNALGYGQSVTTGVVSAKDREVSFTDGSMCLLQTDAAINPGNSGGVLINQKGEVIGINNAKLADTEVEGMGYAIPISSAESTLNDIMNMGTVDEGDLAYLGIQGKTIDQTYSQALGMPSGIYVAQVVAGSPAEKAGICAGDIITKVDGAQITSFDALKSKLNLKKAGTNMVVTVQRSNQNGEYEEQEIKVNLGKRSDYQQASSNEEQQQNQQGQQNMNPYGQNGQGGYYDNDENYGMDPFQFFFGNGSGNGDGGYDYFFGR